MRLNKIQNLVRARGQMMNEQDTNFAFNKWQPWADKSQANAQARQGAENMIWSGLGTAASGGMNLSAGYNDANKWNQFLNPQQQPQVAPGLPGVGGAGNPFLIPGQRQQVAQQQIPQVQQIDFGLPDYMNSQDYMQGAHNMF